MSTAPATSEYDFWSFVACSRCRLPYQLPTGATVPFWLTECGHVICNNHLKQLLVDADQSCAKCGAQNIQLVPLQREMEAPMSDWFRPLPDAIDAIAFAARFQCESLVAQILYYKSRYQQARAALEHSRHEALELKRSNDLLSNEKNQLLQYLNHPTHSLETQQQPSSIPNQNNKRPMIESTLSNSSPRSITTPLGPNRLTLPTGQQPPPASRQESISGGNPVHLNVSRQPNISQFRQQYSYHPPATPMRQLNQPQQVLNHVHRVQATEDRPLAVGRSSGKFKPAHPLKPSENVQNRRIMGPPSTPQAFRGSTSQQDAAGHAGRALGNAPVLASVSNVPRASAPNSGPRHAYSFNPSTSSAQRPLLPDSSAISRYGTHESSSRAPSRATMPGFSNSAHRMPFNPGSNAGFS